MSEADVLLAIPEHVWAHAQQLYRLRRLPVAIVAVPRGYEVCFESDVMHRLAIVAIVETPEQRLEREAA